MSNLKAAAAAMKNHSNNEPVDEPSVISGTMTAKGLIKAMEALKNSTPSNPMTSSQLLPQKCNYCGKPDHAGPCYSPTASQSDPICPGCKSRVRWCSCNMKKLQGQIKAERNTLGWTQKDLATKSGYSQGTITRAERNGWISIGCLLAITRALGKELTMAPKT